MQIGFIGAGKVGFSLGKLFMQNGINVVGYQSKSLESAIEAANYTKTKSYETIEAIVKASDTLFITVPDGEISGVWDHIKTMPVNNKIICHCSGCMSSSVFTDIDELGAFGYSVHPLFAVNSKWHSYEELPKAVFSIEGSSFFMKEMKEMLSPLCLAVQEISIDSKELYHASAVFASNFMVALADIAKELLILTGFEKELALEALKPLIEVNANNICKTDTTKALTGPIERADLKTVQKHLKVIPKQYLDLYSILSEQLITIGEGKNKDKDYSDLKQLFQMLKGQENEKHN